MRDFDATVRNYRDAVTRRCERMCRSGWMDPEDLQQEFWLDVTKMWPRIDPDVGITALLFRILGSTASRLVRARNTRSRTGFEVPLEDWDGGAVAADQDTAVELSRAIDRVDRLPVNERRVLIARVLGAGMREIGDEMGLTVQRISQIEAAARARLKKPRVRRVVTVQPPSKYRPKLNAETVRQIRARLAEGAKGPEIEREFNISSGTVSLIRQRKIWIDVT